MITLLAILPLAFDAVEAPAMNVSKEPNLSLEADLSAATPALVSPYFQDEEGEEELGWSFAFNLGAGLSTGTAETSAGSMAFDGAHRGEKDRTALKAWWSYQRDKNGNPQVSQRRLGGSAQYDQFFSEKTYWLITSLAESDEAANVQLRATVGAGVGHQQREDEIYSFSYELGLNYFYQDLSGLSPDDYPALRLAYNSAWTPNERYSVTQSGELLPSLEDPFSSHWDVYAKLDTAARTTLSESLFAQLQWVLDWQSEPAPGAKEAQNRFFLTIGWTF